MKTTAVLLLGIIVPLVRFATMGCLSQTAPPLINYQGKLTGASGLPISAGVYQIQFRIWDDPKATNLTDLIWSQQQSVAVQTNGVFSALLGAPGGSGINGDDPQVNNIGFAFGSSNRFLGITLLNSNGAVAGSTGEILPRQQLLSVPFAMVAQQARQAQVASSLVTDLANALCPPGTVVAYMGPNIPPGWLLCDGRLISRTLYSALFDAIGTAGGSGDGLTVFQLPDMRGVFLRGVNGSQNPDLGDPDADSRTPLLGGGNSGNAVGSYQTDQFGNHDHQTDRTPIPGTDNGTLGTQTHEFSGGGGSAFGKGGDMRTGFAGGSETRPRNIYVNYIIKY